MSRVKIKFPDENPLHRAIIPVRIGDINYGGHVGNDAILSLIHEARMHMLSQWGYDEMNAGGNSLIMADVMIAYRGEAFYGDVLNINIYADEFTPRSFDLLYHISCNREGKTYEIAHAKTGMACFDYTTRKTTVIKEPLKNHLTGMDN